eukprot:CAMPEP_0185023038 /NCGR_PEP_ID=MMETSP1103-20130426/5734_1 /TAXON_ID=36769 /ORGANISM="Paraphysomonas bandaiensis, Strain Caron Lab Isolate" /LENGTH=416 /DNA_ID=CAMNT_0027555423 /DNA_START=76 /DNA_END=1323 /DNA_ORIENTATION=+
MVPVTTFLHIVVVLTALIRASGVSYEGDDLEPVNGTIRYPSIAFVVHSHSGNHVIQDFMLKTFLRNTQTIVMTGVDVSADDAGVETKRRLMSKIIRYDGHPGNKIEKFSVYKGIHRPLAGIYFANKSFPHVDWIYVMDDDSLPFLRLVHKILSGINASIPLLLGQVGPKSGGHARCRVSSNSTHWSCCTSTTTPCLAHIHNAPRPGAVFAYNKTTHSFEPTYHNTGRMKNPCKSMHWPPGERIGHPYILNSTSTDFVPHITYRLFPYGGATYAVSRGMLQTIGEKNWKRYMDAFRCKGGDLMLMYLVLNFGYSISSQEFGALHGAHDIVSKIVHMHTRAKVRYFDKESFVRMCRYYYLYPNAADLIPNPNDTHIYKRFQTNLPHFDNACAQYKNNSGFYSDVTFDPDEIENIEHVF